MTNEFSSEAIRDEFEQRYINYNLIRADEGYVHEGTEHLWCLFKDYKFANAYQEARIEVLIAEHNKPDEYDSMRKVLLYLQEHKLWANNHAKAIIENALSTEHKLFTTLAEHDE